MPPEPQFNWEINTILRNDTGKPFVGLAIYYRLETTDPWSLVATWEWSLPEARQRGWDIIQAAEASEVDAHLIMTLRERKTPEDEIQEIVARVRSHRGKA